MAIAIICLAAACTDDPEATPSTAVTVTAPTTAPAPVDDGTLTIAVMVPAINADPDIGRSVVAGAQLAINQINDAGGIGGRVVRLITRAESDNVTAASAVIDDLLASDVDAFVGPASSTVALTNTLDITRAGAVACSATSTALSLDQLPDDGRFFRTVPSDGLQARALAELVERTGEASAAMLVVDSTYGTNLADAVDIHLSTRGIRVAERRVFDPAAPDVAAVGRLSTGVVVLIADPDSAAALLDSIGEIPEGQQWIVNDAIRSIDPAAGSAERVRGVSPAAFSDDPAFAAALAAVDPDARGAFAAYSYDCVNLLAIAAASAGSTIGADIAVALPAVSDSGSACATFADCLGVLRAGRNVDYEGASGPVDFDADGNVTQGRYEVFDLDEPNRTQSEIVVG